MLLTSTTMDGRWTFRATVFPVLRRVHLYTWPRLAAAIGLQAGAGSRHWLPLCSARIPCHVRHFALKKPPERRVRIFCAKCKAFLYAYKKAGKGALVKCFVERIVVDATAGDMQCPSCGQQFARFATIKGAPAHKIIGGRVFMRR